MNQSAYNNLLQRVKERCHLEGTEPTSFDIITQHTLHGRRDATTENGLYWPPATIAQLDLTESLLGFGLPAPLRQLYQFVGNGGFGPAYGIIGAYGGAPHAGGWHKDIVDAYHDKWYEEDDHSSPEIEGYRVGKRAYISLANVPAAQEHGRYFELPMSQWPEYLLPLCYWGCNTEHALHAQTGAMYAVVDGSAFALWANSLEEWLARWLDGSLEQE